MTRRRMATAYYDPYSGELTECRFSDEWLTSGTLLRLDTLIDLTHAVTQAREIETGIWAAEWERLRKGKGRRDVH
jgi:hypothetical protein